jgi:MinD-like ATPase involved in chromosome partitioning or flagellar assembly
MAVDFTEALYIAALAAQNAEAAEASALATKPATEPPTLAKKVWVIRDIYGRIRFAVNCKESVYLSAALVMLKTALATLGKHATSQDVLFRDDLNKPDLVFNSTDWHLTSVPGRLDAHGQPRPDLAISVLDRQIMGQDWLTPATAVAATPIPLLATHPHRIVFYGLKGGVGRSTALAMSAWHLAQQGMRVLLFDFDLESPGLSSLLIDPPELAKYGLIDWFVEDAVGLADTELLKNMVSDSALTVDNGSIRVVAAMGREETAYLSKLVRAYVDLPAREHVYPDLPASEKGKGAQRFAMRMQRIVKELEERERPDVVLIDSRAGLHDIAAIAITALADTALLFATDGAQSWNGYAQLFKHWQHRPEVCKHVRTKLAMVQALAPQNDLEKRVKAFRQKAYNLFASTLYDQMPEDEQTIQIHDDPPVWEVLPSQYFNPEMDNQFAPHFPIRIDWDARFQEFNPLLRPEDGGVADVNINACFGALFSWLGQRISNDDEAPVDFAPNYDD